MKFFVDSANLNDIEDALARGFVSGVTTNPSILAKEERAGFRTHLQKIIALLERHHAAIPLSVEVFSTNPKEMIQQARTFNEEFGHYEGLNIKVPIGWDELAVMRELKARGMRVNCTCCMSFNQAMMAASAGADFVSLFYGRIRDIGYDAFSVVKRVHKVFKQSGSASQIIVGSIRHIHDINDALLAGADIVTAPPAFFPSMVSHPKT
ncbi:MAG: transaldolase family protein, partial [Candidatus Binataceae bacterium]